MKIKKKKTSGYAIFTSEQRRKYASEQPELQFSDIRSAFTTYRLELLLEQIYPYFDNVRLIESVTKCTDFR